ncbi:MAG: lipopolysaccharide heptosyltransferase RfaC [Enterobacteriaceae bacterium]
MRILLVKTSSMGDVLHGLPALTDAMQAIPGLSCDWVVEEAFAQIPSWHPAVERVIPVAIRRWRKQWFSAQSRQERHQFVQQLQQQHYDAIIDAQGLLKSAALITRLARGEKHGLDWRSAREPLASLFYGHRHFVAKNQHAVERIRQLFALSLNYPLPVSHGEYHIAGGLQTPAFAPSQNYLMFLHATARSEKLWPESAWRQLIAQLSPYDVEIRLPWGSDEEKQRAERLAQGFTFVRVLPKLSLRELAGMLSGAIAVVSVDTGLSHLAAALSRPNITLYGPTDPGLIGGYGENQQVVTGEGAMDTITAEMVTQKVVALLNRVPS